MKLKKKNAKAQWLPKYYLSGFRSRTDREPIHDSLKVKWNTDFSKTILKENIKHTLTERMRYKEHGWGIRLLKNDSIEKWFAL